MLVKITMFSVKHGAVVIEVLLVWLLFFSSLAHHSAETSMLRFLVAYRRERRKK